MRTVMPCDTYIKRQIIGLDLSLTGTGICHRMANQYSFLEINPKSKEPLGRWSLIRNTIRGIFTGVQDPLILIEGYSFGSHSSSVTKLAEIGGIIRMDILDHGLHYFDIAPPMIKKFVTGKGNSKKDMILLEVYRRWKMHLKSHNLADAFSLVMIGEAALGFTKGMTKDQRSIGKQISDRINGNE